MNLGEANETALHLVAAVTVMVAALAGCSDKFDVDFAACKTETLEVHGLRECMYQRGWLVRDACVGDSQLWTSPACYLR